MRVNQTEIAVLGALSVEPMTGYALRQAIREASGISGGELRPDLPDARRPRTPPPRKRTRLIAAGCVDFRDHRVGAG